MKRIELHNSIYSKLKQWFLVCLIMLASVGLQAQLAVSPPPAGPNYMALVQNFFVGTGVNVSSVTYQGAPTAIGSFTAGANTGFGSITSGIIMSTGNISGAVGSAGVNSSAILNRPGIPELTTLSGFQTFDGAMLTIQFSTQSNQASFRYIFASEEYPEYVATFFDAFALFISGPGIVGQQNIALLPNSTTPITIGNVNAGVNSQYYVNNASSTVVRYDGRTVVMTATTPVQPCQTYTLRIMIADCVDGGWDSAVFLGDNSFSGGLVQLSGASINSDNASIEGCTDASLVFSLAQPQNQPTTVSYTIGGTATNGVDYPTIPTSITIPAGQTQLTLPIDAFQDNITEGQETVTVTYVNPCSTTVVTFFINEAPPYTVSVTPDQPICAGAGPVTLTATGSGGVAPYTINWTTGVTPIGTGTSVSVNPSATTTYTATVTGACPGQGTGQSTITVNPIPTSTFNTTGPYCEGVPFNATYTGTASNAAQFLWASLSSTTPVVVGTNTQAITFPTAGSYFVTLTVTENNCQSPSTSIPITINPTPENTFTLDAAVCAAANNTITYTGTNASPNATYNWNFNGGTVASGSNAGSIAVNWANAGNYNVSLTVTDNGCVSTVNTQPTVVNPIPTATFTLPTAICEGADATLTYTGSASGTATYTWNFGGGTQTAQTGTSYTVTYPADGLETITLVVEENGCISPLQSNNLTVHPIPTANITGDTQLCLNANGNLVYQGSATPGANYTWGFDGGTVNNGSNAGPYNVEWATTGNKNVTVVVTENGCTSPTANYNLAVFGIPTADFTAVSNICVGIPSAVVYTGTGSPTATYTWNFDTGTQTGIIDYSQFSVDYPVAGTYNISLNVEENGCTSPVFTQQVIINGFPGAAAGADIEVCEGQSVVIGVAPVNGNTYLWTGNLPTGLDATLGQHTYTGQSLTNTYGASVETYTLEVTANGCTSTDAVTVTVKPNPQATFVAPAVQCLGLNSFDFAAQGSYSNTAVFNWVFNGALTANSSTENPTNIVFSNTGLQTVTLNVDDNGCTSTFSADVEILPDPVVTFVSDKREGCEPLTISFINTSNITGDATYTWNFGDNNFSDNENETHTYTQSGVYDVTLSVVLGVSPTCKASSILPGFITVHPKPVASFTVSPTTVRLSDALVFVTNTSPSNGVCTYSWEDGSISGECNPTIEFTDTGTYVITQIITSPEGCENFVERIVNVLPDFSLYVPNSFTPNGNGLNDEFVAKGLAVSNFSMIIFNRWGEAVFKTNNINIGWDGTFNGTPASGGVYNYIMRYNTPEGEEQIRRGSVTLLQ